MFIRITAPALPGLLLGRTTSGALGLLGGRFLGFFGRR